MDFRQPAPPGLPFSRHPQPLGGIPEWPQLLRAESLLRAAPDRFQLVRENIAEALVDHRKPGDSIDQILDLTEFAEPLQISQIDPVDAAGTGVGRAFAQSGDVEISHACLEVRI